ncbi:hypothetical protein HYALB_00002423 [Hymenoscyphus albidus]|uniref:Uncharacterized protein n=1 Tax=Hymenoscyphus albidus TaxID=595503 RepID=A0A9N9LUF8_9HELO|nr:hypothetical protein HYALB_00002423 [Hymenoscyphus albidus]
MENRGADYVPRLGPRIPPRHLLGEMDSSSVVDFKTPSRVVEPRAADSTTANGVEMCGANPCEKGTSTSSYTIPIVLGAVIPVVGAIILFVLLQRRHVKKQREEDANDRHASLDFGLGDVPKAAPGMNEKSTGVSRRQVSMDLGLESPYVLPPELQQSRESLHSLSRTVHQKEDPYRSVSAYYGGDARSIHSNSKGGSSIYTGSSTPSRMQELSTADLLGNAASMPRSPGLRSPGPAFVPPPRQNSLPPNHMPAPVSPIPAIPNTPRTAAPPPAINTNVGHLGSPDANARKGLPASPHAGRAMTPTQINTPMPTSVVIEDVRDSYSSRQSNNYLGDMIDSAPAPPQNGLGRPQMPNAALPASPRPPRKDSKAGPPGTGPAGGEELGDGIMVTPPSPGRASKAEVMRGQRYSMDVPPEEFAQAGLGAPGFDAKRLSMGFRPLPPNAATESDDPEIRANRIRSFYKEYFDDSKPAPEGEYIDDYEENYLGDAAYYDPDSNSFIMPYAEPVARRAMTPPPGGRKFMGQGPPRPRNGSMGGVSLGGGRPGGPQFRGVPGPRAHSSASGRMGPPGQQRGRKPMPPPAALNTMPNPSKLRDDSFALMQSMDFAPPTSIRERQQGRSQSPFGERRAYSPTVRAYTPTASAFEELAPMPSPHLLRRSGTFTALDFAPPKRIRDPENMSDAGSIRSNKSGISQSQLSAIRKGAYRASRIPKEAVTTKDDFVNQLKPTWGMRADK